MTVPVKKNIGVNDAVRFFQKEAGVLAKNIKTLQTTVEKIKTNDSSEIASAKEALKLCRTQYKKIEFFLQYFFSSAAIIYNAPAKVELEEPFMEYQEPLGFQVIEAILFEDDVIAKKQNLLDQLGVVYSSASDIDGLLYDFNATDAQVLESLRVQLIRIMTLSISGFDAPLLKTGIEEAYESVVSISLVLEPYLTAYEDDVLKTKLQTTIELLKDNKNFDSFERLQFLTEAAIPLQFSLDRFIKRSGLELNTTDYLNYEAASLFARNMINLDTNSEANKAKIRLGKQLFFETSLSGNSKRSCASCHQPSKGFADGESKNLVFNGHGLLKRNTPTLMYASFQHTQFWEGRAKSLEEQIETVITSPDEMNGDTAQINTLLKKNEKYADLFSKAYRANGIYIINSENIATAIAAYIHLLSPMNSRFDRYMMGDQNALALPEKKGFNLFMGKAQCGTCHFAPIFNGLVPPLYNLTEVEVLGITETDDFTKPKPDNDLGRYTLFPINFYKGAFKTPTVRNVALTAPYMHNGAFSTLEKVVEFYNKGGGDGIGLDVPNQTLSNKPLNLSVEEEKQIVSFLKALTDSIPEEDLR